MGGFEAFERSDGQWDWRLVADNGDVLCGSDQGFRDRTDAERGARAAARTVALALGYTKDPTLEHRVSTVAIGP